MSETEIKEEVELAEAPNVVTKDAEKAEPTHLKNDAEDLGAPVVKPTCLLYTSPSPRDS